MSAGPRNRGARPLTGARARDDRGAVVAIAALVMVSLLTVCALVVDIGYAKQYRRVAQNGADAAALAAAQDLDGYSTTLMSAVATAKTYARKNNPRITDASWVGCRDPELPAGSLTPDADNTCISFPDLWRVRVVLPKVEQPGFFGGVAGGERLAVNASAVAGKSPGGAAGPCGLCVIGGRRLQVAGTTSIQVTGGEIQADNLSANQNGPASAIGPRPLRWYQNNYSNWGMNPATGEPSFASRYSRLAAPVPNPFEGKTVNYSGLALDSSTNVNFSGGTSPLLPNVIYEQSVNVNSGTLTLAPGTYYFAGTLNVRGGARLAGDNVTLVFSCRTACPGKIGDFNFESDSTVNLKAPTTGSYAGMAVMFDPNGSSGTPNQLSGNVTLGGAVYGKQVGFDMGSSSAVINAWTIVAGGNFDANNGTLLIDNTKYASTVGGGGGSGAAGSIGLTK